MGAGVVETQALAAARFHGHRDVVAFPQVALAHLHAVNDELAAAVVGVLDGPLPLAAPDRAGVALLAAGFRVGRSAVEDDLHRLALPRLTTPLAVGDQGQD